MTKEKLVIQGAKEHNLKNVSLELPKNKLIVFTGLSGSGKSSLAFDTIYAEGQRRYVESLSAYARQFLDQLDKPDVDKIEGLSPAISIDQKTASHNPRSTVGTVTEIYDYLRLLFSSIGCPECPGCGKVIQKQSPQDIANFIFSDYIDQQITLYAPIIQKKKGEHEEILKSIIQSGFSRIRLNGEITRLEESPKLDKRKAHSIDIVVDRITVTEENKTRVFDSIETTLKQGKGMLELCVEADDKTTAQSHLFSEHFACPDCQISFPEISPRSFSFNSPIGACETCKGLGETTDFDPDLIIENEDLPLKKATERALNLNNTIYGRRLQVEMADHGLTMKTKISELTPKQRQFFLFGAEDQPKPRMRKFRGRWKPVAPKHWEGVIGNMKRRYSQTYSDGMRFFFRSFMSSKTCEACKGNRLNENSLSIKIKKKTIADLTNMSIEDAVVFFKNLKLSEREKEIAKLLLKEIAERIGFLNNVGLSYLSLNRKANTLSGGEHQRIRLATQIGSGLTGVLYVLDEPSIGLHQHDNTRLLKTLKSLRDLGNTLIVVEHDEETMTEADFIVDIGPKAGRQGGEIIFAGTPKDLKKSTKSVTGNYLSGKKKIQIPKKRRSSKSGKKLVLKGATANNLQNVTLKIPLNTLSTVTGLSGSGKSSLIYDTLHRILMREFYSSKEKPGPYKSIDGLEHLDKVITIDQSPIGRTPRSNPGTYVGVFTPIRELFAKTREARIRGYQPGRFSFNVKGGRCETCQGDGVTKIEMHFLSDVYVTCDTCKGNRYNEETLQVTYKGYTITDVLNMTVNQGLELFENIPMIAKKLKTVQDVGLGYIHIGQRATTLSGGEAQRIKLAKELSKVSTGKTLYLLDEPTTGLHFEDIQHLLTVLNTLVDAGNTVLVIEHNLDIIKTADHIIDLGPEGGKKGGKIIAEGTPEEISKIKHSFTGQYLKNLLS